MLSKEDIKILIAILPYIDPNAELWINAKKWLIETILTLIK